MHNWQCVFRMAVSCSLSQASRDLGLTIAPSNVSDDVTLTRSRFHNFYSHLLGSDARRTAGVRFGGKLKISEFRVFAFQAWKTPGDVDDQA
jgi:hypothetical protein